VGRRAPAVGEQAAQRLGIATDEIEGGHMAALARPRALAERLHRFWTEQGTGSARQRIRSGPRVLGPRAPAGRLTPR